MYTIHVSLRCVLAPGVLFLFPAGGAGGLFSSALLFGGLSFFGFGILGVGVVFLDRFEQKAGAAFDLALGLAAFEQVEFFADVGLETDFLGTFVGTDKFELSLPDFPGIVSGKSRFFQFFDDRRHIVEVGE